MGPIKRKKRPTQRNKTRKQKRKQKGGDGPIPICIYSHSSFFDVLQVQVDYLAKLFHETDQPVYLFTDKPYDKETNLKFTTIEYSEKIPYTKRLLHCIGKVNRPYIIISQENDILLKYDAASIKNVVDTMIANDVDSVDLLSHRVECKDTIPVSDTLSITPIAGAIYPYSVQPRLWKRESAIKLFSSIPGKNYKGSEQHNVQAYIKENQKTYGICCTNPITSFGICVLYDMSFYVSPAYTFLHLTRANRFVPKIKDSDKVDPFILRTQTEIYDKYVKSSNREIEK